MRHCNNHNLSTVVPLVTTTGANGYASVTGQVGWTVGRWDINSAQCPMQGEVITVMSR